MTFEEKIDKLLETNTLGVGSVHALEKKCKVGIGTIAKPLKKGDSPGIEIVKKIKEVLGVNDAWWDSGEEPIYKKNIDSILVNDNPEEVNSDKSPESIYRDLVEANSDYRLVPKTILDGEYRVVPISSLNTQDRLLNQLTKENERLWKLLEEYKARS